MVLAVTAQARGTSATAARYAARAEHANDHGAARTLCAPGPGETWLRRMYSWYSSPSRVSLAWCTSMSRSAEPGSCPCTGGAMPLVTRAFSAASCKPRMLWPGLATAQLRTSA